MQSAIACGPRVVLIMKWISPLMMAVDDMRLAFHQFVDAVDGDAGGLQMLQVPPVATSLKPISVSSLANRHQIVLSAVFDRQENRTGGGENRSCAEL